MVVAGSGVEAVEVLNFVAAASARSFPGVAFFVPDGCRSLVGSKRVVNLTLFFQDQAKGEPGIAVAWRKLGSFLKGLQGVVEQALSVLADPECIPGVRLLGIEFDGSEQGSISFIYFIECVLRYSEIVPGSNVFWLECRYVFKCFGCVPMFASPCMRGAQLSPSDGIRWSEHHCFAKSTDCLAIISEQQLGLSVGKPRQRFSRVFVAQHISSFEHRLCIAAFLGFLKFCHCGGVAQFDDCLVLLRFRFIFVVRGIVICCKQQRGAADQQGRAE